MRRTAMLLAAAATVVVLAGAPPIAAGAAQSSGNWPTYLYSGARSGYNGAEKIVTRRTAGHLTKLWTDTAGGPVSAEPIQVNGVVYYGSWDGYERAVDAASGTLRWKAFLGKTTDTNCIPRTLGVASTATVGTVSRKGKTVPTLFVAGGNGKFYALNAATGAVIWSTPLATQVNGFLWSSPLLYKGNIYEGIASCGNSRVPGGIAELDAATGTIEHAHSTVPKGCDGASVWGSPTVDTATGDIYFATGNAASCSKPEPLAVALIRTGSNLALSQKWQIPASQLPDADSDFGSTPTLFTAKIKGVVHQMVGIQNKDGIYYAFDRAAVSSGPVWRQRMSVGGTCPQCAKGADISPSAWEGQHLFVGSEKTKIGGRVCVGSIRELQPATGKTVWADCLRSGPVLGAITAVPGVVFVGAGNTAYAIDASTGAVLWRYKDSTSGSNFWGAADISSGQVYFGNQDGKLFAFHT
jgi:polyvinyl alcohol dehydrogenase (cytochrome)